MEINPIYLYRGLECQSRYLCLFGGAGSGKSVFAMQKKVVRALTEGEHRFLIVRKVAKTLKESVFQSCIDILKGLGEYFACEINKTNKTILHTTTGSEFLFVGMDDEEKIKSIQGITGIFIEEADALTENDFLQLDLRLRGATKNYKQIILAFNPTDEKHWLVKYVEPQLLPQMPDHVTDLTYINPSRSVWSFKTKSMDGQTIETTTLNTNYYHNEAIDSEYVARLRSLASISPYHYQVYERGRWGVVEAGDRYVPNFSEAMHVDSVPYLEGEAVHYTVDFNVKPHMTGLCIQLVYDKGFFEVRIFKQYALKHPNNHAQALGEFLVADFDKKLNRGLFLYGDASGNNRLGTKNTKTLFEDVLIGLSPYSPEQRIPTHNPRYDKIAPNSLGRRIFTDLLFSGKLPVKIKIDRSCTELIQDLRLCIQDVNGKLAKPKNKDGYEERGHALQALEYFLCHPKTLADYAKL